MFGSEINLKAMKYLSGSLSHHHIQPPKSQNKQISRNSYTGDINTLQINFGIFFQN